MNLVASILRRIGLLSPDAEQPGGGWRAPQPDNTVKPDPAWSEDSAAALAECERRIDDDGEFWGGAGGHFRALAALPRNIAKASGNTFNFSDTNISDISALSQRPDIEQLVLHETIHDFSVLAHLTALRQLEAYKAVPTDISALRHCRSLSRLQLNVAGISDLSPLADLPNLEAVELWNYRGQPLWPDSNVKRLSIVRSPGVSVDLTPLASWPKISAVSLDSNKISGRYPPLPTLQTLFAYNSGLSDLAPLASCAHLETVSLSGTPVSSIDCLLDKSELQQVDVAGTAVTNISGLSWLPKLDQLRADKTAVADLGGWNPDCAITSLSISHTQVTDLLPLAGSRLRFLNISDTAIADLGPIGMLPQLTALLFPRTLVDSIEPVLRHPALLHDDTSDYRNHQAWRLAFEYTPVARSSERLRQISVMQESFTNNKQKALRELYGIRH